MHIGKPFIKDECLDGQECSSLCAAVSYSENGKEKTTDVFFRVEKAYSTALCVEQSDAFLIGVLPLALCIGEDIHMDGAVSERLYWFLTSIYIPTLVDAKKGFKPINIDCQTVATCYNGSGVGTAISCGVDSFYTILSNYRKEKAPGFNVTHLTFFNVGACGYFGGDEARQLFKQKCEKYKEIAAELGLDFLSVDSNLSEFLMMDFNATVTFRTLAAVLAVQKQFKYYLYSAGFKNSEFEIDPALCQRFDFFSCDAFSTESVSFYSTGGEIPRTDKLDYISTFEITHKNLNVCFYSHLTNCGDRCAKCLRTQVELYALGKTQMFDGSFDAAYFKKHKIKLIAKQIAMIPYDSGEAIYLKESREAGKKTGNKLPFMSYIVAIPGLIKSAGMGLLKKIKPLRRMLHRRIAKRSGVHFSDIN